jgi:hypothetical protein
MQHPTNISLAALPTVTLWNSILEDLQGHIQVCPCEPECRGQTASLNSGGAQCCVGTGLYKWVFRTPSHPVTQNVSCSHVCLERKDSYPFHSLRSIGCSCGHNSSGASTLQPSCVCETISQMSCICNRRA